jgi:CubicO group peptidase (beta-lactamase class C family)
MLIITSMDEILIPNMSHENIFKPLGMTTTSFFLTPELESKLVNLAISANGKFEPFVNQVELVEQDPSQCKFLFYCPFPMLSNSTKWNYILAALVYTVLWKTTSFFYVIFFKSRVRK